VSRMEEIWGDMENRTRGIRIRSVGLGNSSKCPNVSLASYLLNNNRQDIAPTEDWCRTHILVICDKVHILSCSCQDRYCCSRRTTREDASLLL